MDKKQIAVAAGLMCLSWAAIIPVYLILNENKRLKEELEKHNGSKDEKGALGEAPVKAKNTG